MKKTTTLLAFLIAALALFVSSCTEAASHTTNLTSYSSGCCDSLKTPTVDKYWETNRKINTLLDKEEERKKKGGNDKKKTVKPAAKPKPQAIHSGSYINICDATSAVVRVGTPACD